MAGKVEVRFYALLRRQLGTSAMKINADGMTVMDLLQQVEEQAGRPFLDELLDREKKLLLGTMILVNGANIRLQKNLATEVHAGDRVDLFSPAGGG